MFPVHSFRTCCYSTAAVISHRPPLASLASAVARQSLYRVTDPSIFLRKPHYRFFTSDILDSDKKSIEEHTGELWRCIGRYQDPSRKGFIYEYQVSYQGAVTNKLSEIFPAIEFTEEYAHSLFSPFMPSPPTNFFNALGYNIHYSSGNWIMALPDKNALLGLYDQLRLDNPKQGLPNLKIFSSKEITPDIAFVQALIQFHAVLSDGKEFIHDHTAHVVPLLKRIFQSIPYFNKFVMESTEFYQMNLNKIEQLRAELNHEKSDFFTEEQIQFLKINFPIIEALLGALVDVTSSKLHFLSGELIDVLDTVEWREYLQKRFSLAKHAASPHPKPPVFDAKTYCEIKDLLPIIDELSLK